MERKRKWSYHFYAHHSPSIGRSNDFGATCIRPKIYGKWSKLRWLERLFNCYKPFETRKDYKEVFLSMWAIYEYLDNPKRPQKEPPNFSFRQLPEKLIGDLPFLLHFWKDA